MPKKIDVTQMSTEEIELRLALIERQRAAVPVLPSSTAAVLPTIAPEAKPEIVRIQGRKPKTPIEERWFSTTKVCPHCGKEKNVGKDFGVVVQRGVQYAASWCNQCRSESSASYKAKPRKNHSVNNAEKPLTRPRPGARVRRSKHNPK